MKQKKIAFEFSHGKIEGILKESSTNEYLVIITNGHDGFYNYGMFPYIQDKLCEHGINSFSYNFSHGGVIGDSDYFDDLDGYEKNSMKLETLDLVETTKELINTYQNSKIILLTHSLGGVPTIFGASELIKNDINIIGVVLISTVKTLNVWPKDMIDKWKKDKVYYLKNNRTKQDLPLGYAFLQEILSFETTWNVENKIKEIDTNILIVHGENDEAVPTEHSKILYHWANSSNKKTQLEIIPDATHTYNTKHPFEKSSEQLDELINRIINWIKKF